MECQARKMAREVLGGLELPRCRMPAAKKTSASIFRKGDKRTYMLCIGCREVLR